MSKQVFDEYVKAYSLPIFRAIRAQRDTIDLTQNSLVDNKEFRVDESLNFDEELLKFYSIIDRWKFTWRTKDACEVELEGTFNILPVKEVLIGDVDFHPDEFPVMRNFTLVDYFYPEAGVGFYLDKPEQGLFYHEFDGHTDKLNLDFKGYLEMLKYTKGVAYWQKAVINPEHRTSSPVIENMHTLFPEVTVEGFYECYDAVRIDK